MAQRIQNLIFDLDNTLINSDELYELSLSDIGFAKELEAFQQARRAVKEGLPAYHTSARNRLLYFKKMLEQEKRFSANKVLKLMDDYEASVFARAVEQVRVLQRIPLFEALKSRGLRLSILTNENLRTQLLKLRAIDPHGEFFQSILVSEEVGIEKPSAEIFHRLLRENNFLISETMMIGDDIVADIEGAKAIGLTTVLTREFSNINGDVKLADYSLEKLDELLEIL